MCLQILHPYSNGIKHCDLKTNEYSFIQVGKVVKMPIYISLIALTNLLTICMTGFYLYI